MSAERASIQVLTPPGPGGVAVLAIAGEHRMETARSILRDRDQGPWQGPFDRVPRLASLVIADEFLDQVLVLDRAERGQLEIHLHGSDALLARIAEHFSCEPAPLSAAQSLLVQAMDAAQIELALEQMALPWSEFLTDLQKLSKAERGLAVAAARERSRIAMAMARPCRLVICGAQNAGKSTLMNRLVASARSLTGSQAGLTRDPVRDLTSLSGYPYLLVDTAGEGRVEREIDRRAQDRARQEQSLGDCRLLLVDGSCRPTAVDRALAVPPCLVLRNKSDLPAAVWPEDFSAALEVSARHQSASELRVRIGESLRALRNLPHAGPVGGAAALDGEELQELAGE